MYYKLINAYMMVKGEKKFIVRFYKPKLFSHYTFAEDDRGCCWDVKDCKKIKGEKNYK